MFADFDAYGGSVGLTSCCVYGGDPYPPQQQKLKKGVDIVVGTPGRIKACLFALFFKSDNRFLFVRSLDLVLNNCRIISKGKTLT